MSYIPITQLKSIVEYAKHKNKKLCLDLIAQLRGLTFKPCARMYLLRREQEDQIKQRQCRKGLDLLKSLAKRSMRLLSKNFSYHTDYHRKCRKDTTRYHLHTLLGLLCRSHAGGMSDYEFYEYNGWNEIIINFGQLLSYVQDIIKKEHPRHQGLRVLYSEMLQIRHKLLIKRASSNLKLYLSRFPDLLERFIEHSRTKWQHERWKDHPNIKDCMAMRLMMEIEDRFRLSMYEITDNYFRDDHPSLLEEEKLGLVVLRTSIFLNSEYMMMRCFFHVPEFDDLIHTRIANNRRFVQHLINYATLHPITYCGYILYVYGDIWLELNPRHMWDSCRTTQKVLYVLINHSMIYDRHHERCAAEQVVEFRW